MVRQLEPVDDPDIATIAGSLETAREPRYSCPDGRRSLTATELARAASVQADGSSICPVAEAQLIAVESVGRHRYFRLADYEVGTVIENLVGLAHRLGATRVRTGPPETALQKARVCYDHLAGELGVLIFDSLMQRGFLRRSEKMLVLTENGERFFMEGDRLATLKRRRRPRVACIDWSVRDLIWRVLSVPPS